MSSRMSDIIKAGETIDLTTLKKLRQHWVETYLGLFLILSKEENKPLERMKEKLAEANEAVMNFFDIEIERCS